MLGCRNVFTLYLCTDFFFIPRCNLFMTSPSMRICFFCAWFWNNFFKMRQKKVTFQAQIMEEKKKSNFWRTLIKLFFTSQMNSLCFLYICGEWVFFWTQVQCKLIKTSSLLFNCAFVVGLHWKIFKPDRDIVLIGKHLL